MTPSAYDRYLEAEILNAEPLKLVGILYRAAIESVVSARNALRAGDIQARSRSITKASEIVNELMRSLDHTAGGDISRNLVELYAYVQTRLLEANAKQVEPPLAEVEQLLVTLADAWRAAAPMPAEPTLDTAYVPVSCVL